MIKLGSLVEVFSDIYSSAPKHVVGLGIVVEEQECLVYGAYLPQTDNYGDVMAKQYKVLINEKFEYHDEETIRELT